MAKEEAARLKQAMLPWETVAADEVPVVSVKPRRAAASVARAVAAAAPASTVVLERREDGGLAVAGTDNSSATSAGDFGQAGEEEIAPADAPPGGIATSRGERDGGGWTIAILCLGLALVAACIIIPQIDANRRLAYERTKLQRDLDQIHKQVAVNEEFLKEIESDPQLAERLAQRQMHMIRKGESVLEVQGAEDVAGDSALQQARRMSPFLITSVPPPPPMPAYKPAGGVFAEMCRQGQTRLYILALGLFLVAAGLVLGKTEARTTG